MTCNRCAATANVVASAAGAGDLEAGWAGVRNVGQVCRVCRNCFLRADGGCTKCENGLLDKAQQHPERYEAGYRADSYPERVMVALAPIMADSRDVQVRQAAASYLTDPATLFRLGVSDDNIVKANVATNPHTPAATLAGLLQSEARNVYRAAALNPALPISALEQQAKEAEQKWLGLVQKALQPLIYQVAFKGEGRRALGMLLLPAVVVGMYGPSGYKSWRRHRDLSLALKQRERNPVPSPEAVQPRPQPVSASDRRPSRLSATELAAVAEELKLAESALEMADDYYEGCFTIDDVVRIQNDGVVSDHDAEIAGYLLEQAEKVAGRFPGWHGEEMGPAEFKQIQEKLRCGKCGQYAGAAGQHQCNYSSRLTALRQPTAEVEAGGLSPVDVYSEVP